MGGLRDAINLAWRVEQLSVALAMDPGGLVRSLKEQRSERAIELALGVRTSIRSFVPPPTRFMDAAPSQPLSYQALRCIERDLTRRALPLRRLVDLGCGRGRALAYLSRLPFDDLVGVEVDPELAAAARANLGALLDGWRQARSVTVLEADAADVELAWAGSALLLFNPFGPHTLRTVLSKVRASLAGGGSAHAYYAAPVQHRVFRDVFPEVLASALECEHPTVYHYQLVV